jgi:AcrR family transcriptional regulator
MARPIAADAAATRRRILDAALAAFADRGAHGASIRTIAGAAGVSLAMVHHYFGDKDGLYEACIEAMYVELATLRVELVDALRRRNPDTLVDRAVRTAFRFARERQIQVRLLLRQVVEAGELAPARREQVQLPFLREASELLGAALERDPQALRLPLQSLVFLISRFAASTQAELEALTGRRSIEAVREVENHLVATARTFLTTRLPS